MMLSIGGRRSEGIFGERHLTLTCLIESLHSYKRIPYLIDHGAR